MPEDRSLPAFMVSTARGFLPRAEPVVELPEEFSPLESILSRMPIKRLDGQPGLLATCDLGQVVETELPNLVAAIEKYRDDLPLMNALYRDYSFLASAYLLEPCHGRFMKGEPYGLAREVLPANIAVPIVKVAEMYVTSLRDVQSLTSIAPGSCPSWSMLAHMPSSIIALKTPSLVLSTTT